MDGTSVAWPMDGRTVLVTGTTTGLGRASAGALARAGARVLVHARDQARAEATARELADPAGDLVPVWADLGSLTGVRELVDQVRQVAPDGLHVLMNNAGAGFAAREVSPEGVERTFALNHLAVAGLTAGLLPLLRAGAATAGRASRVVNVSTWLERRGRSDRRDWAYGRGFRQVQAYCDAKLANLAYSFTQAAQLEGTGVTVNAVNPGNVATRIGNNGGGVFQLVQTLGRPFMLSPADGARTGLRLAGDPALENVTGRYFSGGEAAVSSAASRDGDFGRWVYDHTADLLGD